MRSLLISLLLTLMATGPLSAAEAEKFGGLGLSVAQLYTQETKDHLGPIVVLDVLDGTPAEAAGIEPGDVITHVDGEAVEGKEFKYIVLNQLRGEVGRVAKLTVKRGSEGEKAKGSVVEVKRVEIKWNAEAAPQTNHKQGADKPK